MPFEDYRIAAGWGVQLASLTNIESIVPTSDRAFVPPDVYGSYDPGQIRIRADGTVYLAGFTSVRWRFSVMTRAQHRYLQTTYCNSSYSGKVTIYTRTDAGSATYTRYNAILILPKLPELQKRFTGFEGVTLTFTRLVAL